jgi:hypothetical protein
MFMHLQRTLEYEKGTGGSSFLIPLTLALSHPGEEIFGGMTLLLVSWSVIPGEQREIQNPGVPRFCLHV